MKLFWATAAALAMVACKGEAGTAGATGEPGPTGAVGPAMPVIQSLSATGLPAAPGRVVTLHVEAQSAGELTLAYSWAATAGWAVQAGASSSTVTIAAPATRGATGTATVTVTDTKGRVATGLTSLTTTGNGTPIVSGLAASAPMAARGVATTLTVWAADPDGDHLSYAWTVPPGFEVVSGEASAQLVIRATGFASGLAQVVVNDGSSSATAGIYLGTVDGTWASAQTISAGGPGNSDPAVGVDGSGNAIVVWQHPYLGAVANHYAVGSGWQGVQSIGSPGSAFDPSVAMSVSGVAVAVWGEYDSDAKAYVVKANRYTGSSGWGTPETIDDSGYGNAGLPKVSIDASGNAIAIWQQSLTSRTYLRSRRYVTGRTRSCSPSTSIRTSPSPWTRAGMHSWSSASTTSCAMRPMSGRGDTRPPRVGTPPSCWERTATFRSSR